MSSNRIVRYKIECALNIYELVKVVNSSIESKWQPFGTAFVHDSWLCQTMVLYEEEAAECQKNPPQIQ
jgi:hypothetical protein